MEDLGVDEDIILKTEFQGMIGVCERNSYGSAEGQASGPCEHGNDYFKVFVPTIAQHINTEICNLIASLLHVSTYFGRKVYL